MSRIKHRTAGPDDAAAVARLARSTFTETFENVGTCAFMVGEQADEDHVLRLAPGERSDG